MHSYAAGDLRARNPPVIQLLYLDAPMPVQVGGDTFGDAIAMRFSVQRHALRVRVPQSFGHQAATQLDRVRESLSLTMPSARATAKTVPPEPSAAD